MPPKEFFTSSNSTNFQDAFFRYSQLSRLSEKQAAQFTSPMPKNRFSSLQPQTLEIRQQQLLEKLETLGDLLERTGEVVLTASNETIVINAVQCHALDFFNVMEKYQDVCTKGDSSVLARIDQAVSKIEVVLWRFQVQKPLYKKLFSSESYFRQSQEERISQMSQDPTFQQVQQRNSCPAGIKQGIMRNSEGRGSLGHHQSSPPYLQEEKQSISIPRQSVEEAGLKRRWQFLQLAQELKVDLEGRGFSFASQAFWNSVMGMLGKIDFACEQVANVVIIMLEEGLQKVRIGETLNSVNILLNDMKEFLDSSEPMRPTLQKSRIEVQEEQVNDQNQLRRMFYGKAIERVAMWGVRSPFRESFVDMFQDFNRSSEDRDIDRFLDRKLAQ